MKTIRGREKYDENNFARTYNTNLKFDWNGTYWCSFP